MSGEVLIFLHMDDEHPGYIADFLQQKAIPYRIIRAYSGESIPALDESMVGLVFMGGIMSVNDDIPWLQDEIRLITQALDKGVPLLGHCLGGQLISNALGEKVTENSVKEVGWHSCIRASRGKTNNTSVENELDWLGDTEDPFAMFHWHGETFAIPEKATPLFSSTHCKNQAYSYADNVLAMQCHVEMTLPLISNWINTWRDDLTKVSASEQSYDQIKENLEEKINALNRVAHNLYTRWVSRLNLENLNP